MLNFLSKDSNMISIWYHNAIMIYLVSKTE